MSRPNHIHLSAEQIQAFLDGELLPGRRERRQVEEHLSACARCSSEVDAWRTLFADLGELAALPRPQPSPGFAERVMTEVRIRETVQVAPQERGWLASIFPSKGGHLSGDVLQDLADGLLPARRAARAHAHLGSCATCTGELEAWRGVMATLARVPGFSPPEAFADRVMSALQLQTRPATAAAVARPSDASAKVPWERALVGARRLAVRAAVRMVPRTRRAWAALSGIAVTPAVIFGLVFWVVFSHPTLTPQALASFAIWQISDLVAAGWSSLLANGQDATSAAAYESVLQALTPLTQSPLVLAGGALLYSAVAALALRVLYKTLISHRRYARVSSR